MNSLDIFSVRYLTNPGTEHSPRVGVISRRTNPQIQAPPERNKKIYRPYRDDLLDGTSRWFPSPYYQQKIL
jgi:hypothetical protein